MLKGRATGDDWRALHPGKGRAASQAAWEEILRSRRKAGNRSLSNRQSKSVKKRNVKVTLPHVTMIDDKDH